MDLCSWGMCCCQIDNRSWFYCASLEKKTILVPNCVTPNKSVQKHRFCWDICKSWHIGISLAPWHTWNEVTSKYLELILSVGHPNMLKLILWKESVPTAGRLFIENSGTLVWFVRYSGFRKTTWNFTDTLWLHHKIYKDTKTIKNCLKKRNSIFLRQIIYISPANIGRQTFQGRLFWNHHLRRSGCIPHGLEEHRHGFTGSTILRSTLATAWHPTTFANCTGATEARH